MLLGAAPRTREEKVLLFKKRRSVCLAGGGLLCVGEWVLGRHGHEPGYRRPRLKKGYQILVTGLRGGSGQG